ncbi:DUF4118 domain-containing protein [Acrocarpospora sp. B8E8]|uniref:DUF4118 domain-containing protein n=1 Tax=Acrocarpospora sp. B8E8 TaxID=3153572 RepID=UPI00325F2CA8
MPIVTIRDVVAIGAAVLGPLTVAVVMVPSRGTISTVNLVLILVVVVVAVATLGNRFAGAIAALSSAVWFAFFFTPPYYQFAIFRSVDLQTTVLLVVIGVMTSQLAVTARRVKVLAVTDADYLARVHEIAMLAQTAAAPSMVIDAVARHLTQILYLRRCHFEYGPSPLHLPHLDADGTIVLGHRHVDVERHGLPDREIELPVFGDDHCYGRYLLRSAPGTSPSRQARLAAVSLADQVGNVLAAATSHHAS